MKPGIRICAALLCALIVSLMLPMRPLAAGAIDMTRPSSLTVTCRNGSTALVGAQFDLYQVAKPSPSGGYELTGSFTNFPVSLDDLTAAKMQALAGTLEIYTALNGVAPQAVGTTNALGTVTFTGLEPGLYLVLGRRHVQDNFVYTAKPILVFLPTYDETTNQWVYDMTVACKFTVVPQSPPGDTVSRKVLKIWDDDGREAERPQQITVHLLRNGRIYDTVLLSDSNNWRYTWEELDADASWTVAEDVPTGYTVSVMQEGITFVITNSKPPEETPSPSPPPPPKLPQTGQLWWPVPLLAAAGMILFLVGYIRNRGADDET